MVNVMEAELTGWTDFGLGFGYSFATSLKYYYRYNRIIPVFITNK
jgi:hypothetical protein